MYNDLRDTKLCKNNKIKISGPTQEFHQFASLKCVCLPILVVFKQKKKKA